ncbi:MAG: hypothetical protein U0P81_00080 [Holophagaceae bacterium]
MPTKPFRSLSALVLGLAPLAAGTPDFNPVLAVAHQTWPEKQHLAVVCNASATWDGIQALAAAAAPGSLITVVDTRTASALPAALRVLEARKADFLVVMPTDPIYFDGGYQATLLVRGLAQRGVPSVGTSQAALRQGAVYAIGERTGGQLLVTDKVRGTVSVILPSRTASFAAGAAYAPNTSYLTGRGVQVSVTTVP